MAKLIQWVVRGVDEDLARQFVDRAARQRRNVGEVLNGVLRACLEQPESPDGGPSAPGGAVADLAAQFAALVERVGRLEAGAGTTVPGHPSPNAAAPVGRARKPAVASKARTARKPVAVSDSGDIEGGKKDNRLPDYVYDKVRDLIEKHPEMKNPAIGKAVGISKETVRRIRNGIR
jgi:hypothetical protein